MSEQAGVEQAHPIQTARLRSPRMTSVVAEYLRSKILNGELPDGSRLPKEDDLRARLGVGRPTIREALRILESEGLITVLRGNRGGAVVHTPHAFNAAYALGLALSARKVRTGDLGLALRQVEPLAAVLCAKRTDRGRAVVPQLRSLLEEARRTVNEPAATIATRRFHEEVVALCGNETLILVVGALEALWSRHVQRFASRTSPPSGARSTIDHARSVEEHCRIVDLIEAGKADKVADFVREHLERIHALPTAANQNIPIDVNILVLD